MKKILPLIMLLIGAGAGVGAGVYLRPDAKLEEADGIEAVEEHPPKENEEALKSEIVTDGKEYIKLSNQFVVPIVAEDKIESMIVMTLSVETMAGSGQDVYDIEPKVRDVFLRVLFDHATIGGFSGAFLNNENLDTIRENLKDAARSNFGSELISDVLIFEIARQDY